MQLFLKIRLEIVKGNAVNHPKARLLAFYDNPNSSKNCPTKVMWALISEHLFAKFVLKLGLI